MMMAIVSALASTQLPAPNIHCDLVDEHGKRQTLDAAFIPKENSDIMLGSIEIKRTSLPNLAGRLAGLDENFRPPHEAEGRFLREDRAGVTGVILMFASDGQKPIASISITGIDADARQRRFFAAGICKFGGAQ